MPNFGERWANPKRLDKGGQGITYLVTDTQTEGNPLRVAKILKEPDETRKARFLQEIRISETFDHPNVVRALTSGETAESKFPFFIMPYYKQGTLEDSRAQTDDPLQILELFAQICEGVAYVHATGHVHRDLKPPNVFIDGNGNAVVGDFGLSYRYDSEAAARLTASSEIVGARKYMPPEWREGRVDMPHPSGDVYSLGKILYWMFAQDVYDRDEQDYDRPERKLSHVLSQRGAVDTATGVIDDRFVHAAAFADEIIALTVRYDPEMRLQNAAQLLSKMRQYIARFRAGGRALDLTLPMRCIFCATGAYAPLAPLPPLKQRLRPLDPTRLPSTQPDIYKSLRDAASYQFGILNGGEHTTGTLVLVCQHCGNAQIFRLDLAPKASVNWRP